MNASSASPFFFHLKTEVKLRSTLHFPSSFQKPRCQLSTEVNRSGKTFSGLLASAHLLTGLRPLWREQIVTLVRYLSCKLKESSCPENATIIKAKSVRISLSFGKEREHG